MSLRCPECGHETVVSVRFCPSCGEEMPAQEAAPESEAEREQEAGDQPPGPEPTARPEAQPETPPEPPPTPPSSRPSIITIPATVGQPAEPPNQPPTAATPPQQSPPSPGQPPSEPSVPPTQTPTPPPTAPPASAQPPPKKKSKAWLWACGGCGCLALLVAAILGALFFVGVREQAREAQVISADQDAPEVVEEASSAEEVATDHYEVTIPPGWSRESGLEDDILAVSGPEVNGEQLSLLIWVDELSDGVSLEQFSDQVLERYRNVSWSEDTTEASLCDEPARRVALTTDNHDYLIYVSVYKAQGFVLVMLAPEGTMGEQESTFDQVLDEFAMYE